MFTRAFYHSLAFLPQNISVSTGYTAKNRVGTSFTVKSGFTNLYTDFATALINFRQEEKTSTSGSYYYIAFGDGDAPPTLDDYQLSGAHITTYNATSAFRASDNCDAVTAEYTLTNTGDAAFTVKEVGVFTPFSATSSQKGARCTLAYRAVLDTPVTIEPGGVGQVVITFKVNVPE